MRILFSLHGYPPDHNCGGEYFFHNIAKFMISKGHEVKVLLKEDQYERKQMYTIDGVDVFPPGLDQTVLFRWSQVVLTHLGWAPWTIHIANCFNPPKPTVFISQNYHHYDIMNVYPKTAVIYNSNYMASRLEYKGKSITVHPPCDYRKWDFGGPTGEYITLINLNLNKGARLFKALAEAMPSKKFLAIAGSYDSQFLDGLPTNVTMWGNSPNMEPVYTNTRLLLMPSAFESWGMTATEAMCNGIPVIYNETQGLRENVGECGIMLKNLNPDYTETELKGGEHPGIDPIANLPQWVKAIERMDNPKTYQKYSNLARKRSRELDPVPELEKLEQFLWAML